MKQGELEVGEPHPAAMLALQWLRDMPNTELIRWQESFSSCAISGNRLADICSETLRRLIHGDPVSDRYILGLYTAMQHGPSTKVRVSKPKSKRPRFVE